MVLLEESPATLLALSIKNFDTTHDTDSLRHVASSLGHLRGARTARHDKTRATLRALSRQSEAAAASLEDARGAAQARAHGDKMDALDRAKFALAKEMNELESAHHSLEGELARLRAELDAVDADDAVAREAERDGGDVLKLRLYRSLGIDVEEDGAGGYGRAVIRNSDRGDVHVVAIEDKFSPAFYANYFWNAL